MHTVEDVKAASVTRTGPLATVVMAIVLLLAACAGESPAISEAESTDPVAACGGRFATTPSEGLSVPAQVTFRDTGPASTLAFAAADVVTHLQLAGVQAQVVEQASATAAPQLRLAILEREPELAEQLGAPPPDGYVIDRLGDDVVVFGFDEKATMYGAYELLRRLGFSWHDPFEPTIPRLSRDETIDFRRIVEQPSIEQRGFWMWSQPGQAHPDDFAVWMARNRLNLGGGFRPELAAQLGITQWGGGHYLVAEAFGDESLLESNPEWFPVVNGVRRSVASGFNPVFGEPGVADHFADYLIERIASGELAHLDIVNVWPADSPTPGVWDQGATSAQVGNETDNLLLFYTRVAERLAAANDSGVIARPITLGGISYYVNWEPPTNASVVERLESLPYLHVFYTNERSWMHDLETSRPLVDANAAILDDLEDWATTTDFASGVVEYHNYSIYSGVAVIDLEHTASNHEFLSQNRQELHAYMHPLLKNPGPRRLTNALLAEFGWVELGCSIERAVEADQIADRYFRDRYGDHADTWHEVYRTISASTSNVKEMFGQDSLTSVLLADLFWAPPPRTPQSTLELAQRYLVGGANIALVGNDDVPRGQATFKGLDESLRMQRQARQVWQAEFDATVDPLIRDRMRADIAWFETTERRYLLLRRVADLYASRYGSTDQCASEVCTVEAISAEIRSVASQLVASPVTQDTLSPVDQRAPILNVIRWLEGPGA